MKKMRLSLDTLRVESFAPADAERGHGTVHGHARYTDPAVCPYSQNWYCTVGDGCTWGPYTCFDTCGDNCDTIQVCTA